jgi:prevent-host-death family protein
MKQQVSLHEARRHLSRYIVAVERGDEIIITKRGKPAARLVRVVEAPRLTPEKEAALQALFGMGVRTDGRTYTREGIHDERMEELTCVRHRKR